jgi:hypothetical protein
MDVFKMNNSHFELVKRGSEFCLSALLFDLFAESYSRGILGILKRQQTLALEVFGG